MPDSLVLVRIQRPQAESNPHLTSFDSSQLAHWLVHRPTIGAPVRKFGNPFSSVGTDRHWEIDGVRGW